MHLRVANAIVGGSKSFELKIYNLTNHFFIYTIPAHTNRIAQLKSLLHKLALTRTVPVRCNG
jgi:hypothetical protein